MSRERDRVRPATRTRGAVMCACCYDNAMTEAYILNSEDKTEA